MRLTTAEGVTSGIFECFTIPVSIENSVNSLIETFTVLPKLADDICLLGMSVFDSAMGYIRSSTGQLTFEFFKTKQGKPIPHIYKQTTAIEALTVCGEIDQQELVNLIYTVSPDSRSRLFLQPNMFLVADEDCVINPSFPDESHSTDSDDTGQVLLTAEAEAPGLVKVRAKVGSTFVNNITPILTDLRQVPDVSFLTQPDPALINRGGGVISLFNCSLCHHWVDFCYYICFICPGKNEGRRAKRKTISINLFYLIAGFCFYRSDYSGNAFQYESVTIIVLFHTTEQRFQRDKEI